MYLRCIHKENIYLVYGVIVIPDACFYFHCGNKKNVMVKETEEGDDRKTKNNTTAAWAGTVALLCIQTEKLQSTVAHKKKKKKHIEWNKENSKNTYIYLYIFWMSMLLDVISCIRIQTVNCKRLDQICKKREKKPHRRNKEY